MSADAPTAAMVASPSRLAAPAKLLTVGAAKSYGEIVALAPLDLDVPAGEFLTFLGPSGSGKTTVLQVICGLVEPTAGRIVIDGQDRTHTPASRRNLGVVFQNYALFPHMTVTENVAFPLQMRRYAGGELKRRTADALDLVGLAHLGTRFPGELSGGQQQRVALARCFVYEPSLILMDEPLGALDRKLRDALQIEIKRLHRSTGATIIFVTHDQEEALAMSDRICLMRSGGIEQIGSPQAVYDRPETLFAADFIGLSNIIRGRLGEAGTLLTDDGPVALPPGACTHRAAGQSGALVIRPEWVEIVTAGPSVASDLAATVTEMVYAGSETRLLVRLPSGTLMTVRRYATQEPVGIGQEVGLRWSPERGHFLAA